MAELAIEHLTKLSAATDGDGMSHSHTAEVLAWVNAYLTQPNAQLGRAGPVCPFARPSLDRNLLWIATIRGASPTVADVTARLDEFRDVFPALDPVSGPDSLLKAILVAFPDVTDCSLIDEVQAVLKPAFVSAGLMVGQFYEGCQEPGLWNDGFRPLRSPVPLIAIRHMVSSDFPFLNANPGWIETYLRRFAPTVPSQVRSALAGRFGDRSANPRSE